MNQKVNHDMLLFAILCLMFMAYLYIETQKIQHKHQELLREKQKEKIIIKHKREQRPIPRLLPVNTRHVENYEVIGYLQQLSGERILPLYGRRLHVSATLWNYYTRTDHDRSMLIPIVINGQRCTERYGCKELFEDDTITIPEYGGEYVVHLY